MSKVWQDIKLTDIHDGLYMHMSRWIRCMDVHMSIKANHVFDPGGAACDDEVSSAWDTVQLIQENKRRSRCYFYGISTTRSNQILAGTVVCFFWRSGPPEIKASTKEFGALKDVCV